MDETMQTTTTATARTFILFHKIPIKWVIWAEIVWLLLSIKIAIELIHRWIDRENKSTIFIRPKKIPSPYLRNIAHHMVAPIGTFNNNNNDDSVKTQHTHIQIQIQMIWVCSKIKNVHIVVSNNNYRRFWFGCFFSIEQYNCDSKIIDIFCGRFSLSLKWLEKQWNKRTKYRHLLILTGRRREWAPEESE